MAYKKYIVKNGKVYGPYLYHSKRVDGKVVSEYHGPKKHIGFSFPYKNFLLIFLTIMAVILLVHTFTYFSTNLYGKVTSGLEANYVEGEALEGVLKFNINQGELIPSGSKIVFEGGNKKYEFNLADVVSDDSTEGDFYVQGKDISGSGSGYGIEGTKDVAVPVDFVINVYSESDSEEAPEEPSDGGEDVVVDETSNESEEVVDEITEQESIEESDEGETEVVGGQEGEPLTSEQESDDSSPKEPVAEEEPESESEESEATEGSSEAVEAEITGGIIGFFRGIFDFFLPTGHVSLELEREIAGTTYVDTPYIFELLEGENYELVSSSQDVEIIVEGNQITVTTNYVEEQEGFGEGYSGDSSKVLEIDVSNLDIVLEPGELKVSLIYEEEKLVSLETVLEEGDISVESEPDEEELEELGNESIEQNITVNESIEQNITVNESIELNVTAIEEFSLSESEKDILIAEFGNESVDIIKAEEKNNRLFVKFELGNYWIEYTYSIELSEEELDKLIEEDRIKWLKDLAEALSQGEIEAEERSDLIGNYSI